jgi:UDP-glucose 4-epimerase
VFEAPRSGDILHSLADISVAQEALGYRVLVPFEEGVRRTVAWYREAGAV